MRAIWFVIGILLIVIGVAVAVFFPWMFPTEETYYSFGGVPYTMTMPNMTYMFIGIPIAAVGGILVTAWIISYSRRKGKEFLKEAIKESLKESREEK